MRRRRASARAAAAAAFVAALAFLQAACVRFQYGRIRREEPIALETLQKLRPGESDLGRCLAALGAPNFVWEYDGDGMAIAWIWQDKDEIGFSASWSPFRYAPGASASWQLEDANLPGCVLWFRSDLVLEKWRHGKLDELVPTERRRPAPVVD